MLKNLKAPLHCVHPKSGVMRVLALLAITAQFLVVTPIWAADVEAGAWPEFDIWIGLDEKQKNRIYILKSFSEEPNFSYEEEATGISLDHRINPSWSVRAGIRYISKQVDPPDANETRAVFDAKWFKPLGNNWLLTDRNRIDVRWIEGTDDPSYRYRNRLQLEKPFKAGNRTLTGFGSYELYYDTRFDDWQRQRLILGVSVPLHKKLSVDVFYGYHTESQPKDEHADAVGIAIGIYFY